VSIAAELSHFERSFVCRHTQKWHQRSAVTLLLMFPTLMGACFITAGFTAC